MKPEHYGSVSYPKDRRYIDFLEHLVHYLGALFVSSSASMLYEDWRGGSGIVSRNRALYGRTRAVVVFDRYINNELHRIGNGGAGA